MLRKQILPLREEALLGNKVLACGSLFCLMSFVLGRDSHSTVKKFDCWYNFDRFGELLRF